MNPRRCIPLALVLIVAACAGAENDTPDPFESARVALQLLSPEPALQVAAKFSRTLTNAPVLVTVKHWDSSVPDKFPPFRDTEIGGHGLCTITLSQGDLDAIAALFPAGVGPNGFTVHGEMPETAEPGTYHVVHFEVDALLAVVPGDPTLLFEYAFVFDADGVDSNDYTEPNVNYYTGTDRWYEMTYTNAQGWRLRVYTATSSILTAEIEHTITEVESAARVIMSENAMLLLVPADEFETSEPDYRVTAFIHDGDFGIPPPHSWSGNPEPRVVEGLQAYPNQN